MLKRRLFEEHVKEIAKNPPPDEEEGDDEPDMPDTKPQARLVADESSRASPPSEGKATESAPARAVMVFLRTRISAVL